MAADSVGGKSTKFQDQIYLPSRVRASLANAAARNPFTRQPWATPPAWVGGTAYNARNGYMVKNSGNRYLLQSGGTAAASGGPTGAGAGPITDGTCTWYYDGPDVAVQIEVSAPTYAIQTKPSGLTKNVPYNASGAFFFTGGTPTYLNYGYRFPAANRAPASGNTFGTYDSVIARVSFESDAPKIWIQGGGTWYAGSSGMQMQIECDGRFIQPGCIQSITDVASAGLTIDWSGARKMRRYTFWIPNNFSFFGVDVDPASTVAATSNPARYRIVVNGDSLSAGANGLPVMGRTWMDQFAYAVGCDDIYCVAVGGTGYVNNQSNSVTTYAGRVPDALGFNPDVHIVAGLYNDASYTSTQRQNAIADYCQRFRAGSAAKLMVFGTAAESNGGVAFATADADIAAVITALGDANTIYFPASADTVPWITGTGNVGATTGAGNADVYVQPAPQPPHFTQAGADYVARRYAQAYTNYWASVA